VNFSEIFIRRPVLSTVLAAFILLLGLQGLLSLPVRQYPEVEETVVTITTVYPGASSDLIQGFVTAADCGGRRDHGKHRLCQQPVHALGLGRVGEHATGG